MTIRQQLPASSGRDRAPAAPSVPARVTSTAAMALALQRAAGNRAAARLLSRWQAHPDKEKKGVMVPDVVAADYTRFNPPINS